MGRIFEGITRRRSWYEAKTFCEDLGQRLMTVDSQEEETNFRQFFSRGQT